MRVIWKDSNSNTCPPVIYKKVKIERYDNEGLRGWTIDIDGDNNIYASQDCAKNAIIKATGGKPRKEGSRVALAGIKIIGTK